MFCFSIFLFGCNGKALKNVDCNNPDYNVQLIFEVDGIKVYRFKDAFRDHYFCTSGTTFTNQYTRSGKSTAHFDEEIQTINGK